MRIHFTDTNISKVTRPTKGTVWLVDDEIRGLQMSLGQSTARFYVFLMKDGKNRRVPIGYFPSMKTQQARAEALRVIGEIKSGTYKIEEQGRSLREVFDRATKERVKSGHLLDGTAETYRGLVTKYCAGLLEKPVTSITRDDIRELKDELSPYTFNQVSRVLSATFRTEGVDFPTVKRNKETARETKITDNAKWYGQVMKDENPIRRTYLLLAALTGIRRRNLAALEMEKCGPRKANELLHRAKHNKDLTLPLSDYAVELLKGIRNAKSKHVFPSPKAKSGHIEDPRGGQDGRIHDLRRMHTTACFKADLFESAIAKLRGDVMLGTAAKYFVGDAPHEWANRVAKVLLKDWGIDAVSQP